MDVPGKMWNQAFMGEVWAEEVRLGSCQHKDGFPRQRWDGTVSGECGWREKRLETKPQSSREWAARDGGGLREARGRKGTSAGQHY